MSKERAWLIPEKQHNTTQQNTTAALSSTSCIIDDNYSRQLSMRADNSILFSVPVEDFQTGLQPNPLVHFVEPAVNEKADGTVLHD